MQLACSALTHASRLNKSQLPCLPLIPQIRIVRLVTRRVDEIPGWMPNRRLPGIPRLVLRGRESLPGPYWTRITSQTTNPSVLKADWNGDRF